MRMAMRISLIIMGLLVGLGTARAATLDRMVAVVNGDIILYSELQDQLRMVAKMAPELNTDDPAKRAQLEREVLHQMVRDRLADEEIRRLKIVVSEREVDEAIERIKQENRFTDTQLEYMIQQEGQTRAQFRDAIKKEIERSRLVDRVLKSKIIITENRSIPFSPTMRLPSASGGVWRSFFYRFRKRLMRARPKPSTSRPKTLWRG